MDDALSVREDLRSYALRRCIRFYTALVVTCVTWVGSRVAAAPGDRQVLWGGAFLLLVMAGVEVASMIVMRDMARARDRIGGGPETPLWAFAQGPWPSLVAAGFFGALAVAMLAAAA